MSKNTFIVTVIISALGMIVYLITVRPVVAPDSQQLTSPSPANSTLTEAQARKIAEKSCIKGGEALASGIYNENTQTWWFDANLNTTRPGCSPACVVSELTQTAEINWRCTGLTQPEN